MGANIGISGSEFRQGCVWVTFPIPDICPILLQVAVRAPVILLVVYDLGALGANNRGMSFAPTSLTGMLRDRPLP
jgi:hypothetical protein